MSAKGVSKGAQAQLKHELYKEALQNGTTVRANNTRIASDHHQLFTRVENKKALTAFDDKRYVCDDGITTLPFGHKSLNQQSQNVSNMQPLPSSSKDESAKKFTFKPFHACKRSSDCLLYTSPSPRDS